VYIKIKSRAEDIFAEKPRAPGIFNGGKEPFLNLPVLAPHIYIPGFCPEGKTGDGNALNQFQGQFVHDKPVLECARLALVGITDNVFGRLGNVQKMFPFTARRIRRAAAPQKFCLFYLGDNIFAGHADGFFQRVKTACLHIFIN